MVADVFYKTICKVNNMEFEAAQAVDDNAMLTASVCGGQEVASAFKPRQIPKAFPFFRLYR
jgi:hypothetical protein